MVKVYVWPADQGAETIYADPNRLRITERWGGAPGQITEQSQRARVEISGPVNRTNAAEFDIAMDRLRGGQFLLAVWDMEMRKQFGWDVKPALNTSGGELWRADGNTSIYNGESANPPTGPWRSVFALAAGGASAGATSLSIDGLIASEVIPRGVMIRVGDYRYRVTASVTANGSGEATLALSTPLRGPVANNTQVRVPGDLFVGRLASRVELGATDADGLRAFKIVLSEVYEDELDNTISPTEFFEWVTS